MIKKVLTIAGSDSSGGAGIQADIKTFCASNVYGMSVITAVTAQNSKGILDIVQLPDSIVDKQLEAVFSDILPNAIKIGMLSNIDICKVVYKYLEIYNGPVVIDPVMVSTSGRKLLDDDCIKYLKEFIFKKVTLITPNIPEAEALSGIKITTEDDIKRAYGEIRKFTKSDILIKGGHFSNDESSDYLFINGKMNKIKGNRVNSSSTHGTGCTLSSAIASNLAKGMNILDSVTCAKEYITKAIEMDLKLIDNNGPLNHMLYQDK